MVRVSGIEPDAQPWEGCILATIRYPHIYEARNGPAPDLKILKERWHHGQ